MFTIKLSLTELYRITNLVILLSVSNLVFAGGTVPQTIKYGTERLWWNSYDTYEAAVTAECNALYPPRSSNLAPYQTSFIYQGQYSPATFPEDQDRIGFLCLIAEFYWVLHEPYWTVYGVHFADRIRGCPVHSYATSNVCTCDDGYKANGSECIELPPCPANSTVLDDNRCTCNSGYYADASMIFCSKNPPSIFTGDNAGAANCSSNFVYRGNPINAGTGLKVQVETDYRATSGLEFKRAYNSTRAFEPVGKNILGDAGWRLTLHRSINVSNHPPLPILVAAEKTRRCPATSCTEVGEVA